MLPRLFEERSSVEEIKDTAVESDVHPADARVNWAENAMEISGARIIGMVGLLNQVHAL